MLETGLQNYVHNLQTRVISHVQLYLAAFILALSERQLETLRHGQLSFDGESLLRFSNEFIRNEI